MTEAVIAGLEKYGSFANVAKAVDEALHAEKEGIDPGRLGKALLQIAENNSFSVDAWKDDNMDCSSYPQH